LDAVHAKALIGIEIDPMKLFRDEKIRGCTHPEEDIAGANFCRKCSAPSWKDVVVTADGVEPKNDYLASKIKGESKTIIGEVRSVCGMPVIRHSSGRMFLGSLVETRSANLAPVVMKTPDAERLQSSLKTKLTPLGLWDEANFGVWVFGERIR
jgi:hypothetical protein